MCSGGYRGKFNRPVREACKSRYVDPHSPARGVLEACKSRYGVPHGPAWAGVPAACRSTYLVSRGRAPLKCNSRYRAPGVACVQRNSRKGQMQGTSGGYGAGERSASCGGA
eukprot:gene19130-biopygen17475